MKKILLFTLLLISLKLQGQDKVTAYVYTIHTNTNYPYHQDPKYRIVVDITDWFKQASDSLINALIEGDFTGIFSKTPEQISEYRKNKPKFSMKYVPDEIVIYEANELGDQILNKELKSSLKYNPNKQLRDMIKYCNKHPYHHRGFIVLVDKTQALLWIGKNKSYILNK